jgi:hypothetical protein
MVFSISNRKQTKTKSVSLDLLFWYCLQLLLGKCIYWLKNITNNIIQYWICTILPW